MGVKELDTDDFARQNQEIYQYEEGVYGREKVYQTLSLLCISLLDLGLVEVATYS